MVRLWIDPEQGDNTATKMMDADYVDDVARFADSIKESELLLPKQENAAKWSAKQFRKYWLYDL